MRVVFYDAGYETFGVQYLLSTLRKEGFDTELFFDSSFGKDYLAQDFFLTRYLSLSPHAVCDNLLALAPDIVCFSLYTLFYQDNLAVIRELKRTRPDLPIVCGGFHASLLPHVVLGNPEVDFVVIGEAELSLPRLLRRLGDDTMAVVKAAPPQALPGIWSVADGDLVNRGLSPVPHDLDALPFPEKELYYRENPTLARLYTAIASRGCPYACTYCNSATMNELYRSHGERYWRVRSVGNVIAELKAAKDRYRPRHVMFFDDVFGARKDWLAEFAERYRREVDLPYYCQTSPLIHDRESLRLLADSGCRLLEFGFQSANTDVRRTVLNRHEETGAVRDLVTEAVRLGMFTELDLIANLPGETQEHLTEALDFVMDTRPHWVNLAFLQFHPRTPITDMAIRTGLLQPEDTERIEQGRFASSMRLLSKSGLGKRYRVFPFQVFAAFFLPRFMARLAIRLVAKPGFADLCSCVASVFLYASRILLSYTDRRDFLVRHHVARSLRAARQVRHRKGSRRARQ